MCTERVVKRDVYPKGAVEAGGEDFAAAAAGRRTLAFLPKSIYQRGGHV